jgi:hypothetical protein
VQQEVPALPDDGASAVLEPMLADAKRDHAARPASELAMRCW